MDYARYKYFLASSQLGLAMLGMGSLLAPRDFAEVVLRPRGLFVGLGLQLLAVPLLAAVIGRVLAPEPVLASRRVSSTHFDLSRRGVRNP